MQVKERDILLRKMAKNSHTPLVSFEDLRPYIKLLGKNWWLLAVMAVAGYSGGRLVTHQMVDVHNATAEILVNQKESNGNGIDAMLGGRGGSRGFSYYNDDVQNQLRVLRSYDLVGRAIDKINDPIDHHLVGRIKEMPVAGFGAIDLEVDMEAWGADMAGAAIDLFVLDAQRYKMVLRATQPQSDQVALEASFGQRVQKEGIALTVRLDPDVARSAERLEAATLQHFRIRVKTRDQRIGQYRGSLQTTNVERTSIITLTCRDVIPGRAKRFLDSLAATYIDYTAEARLATSLQTEVFIDGQLDEINALTDTLERQVDFYRAQNEVLDLTREQNEYFNSLVDLERQLREMDVQAESLDDLGVFLTAPGGTAELPPSSYFMLDDPWMGEQMGALMELEAKRSAMLLDVQPGSYQVRRLDSSAQHVRSNVVSYLADKMGTVERRRINLQSDIRGLESRLSGLPKTQRDILAMERKLGVNEKLAVYLLERKAATIIARASITPEASLIERARYAGMVGPDKRRTILTYTAAGLLLALALAVARMLLFERLETMSELREAVESPVIGGIPFYLEMAQDPIACRADSRSTVTEAFRALRTNLQYLLAKEGANVILVSSLHPQEGKSFVSSNLASILAKAGKKVALVDFDMHKPRVHHYLGMSNDRGASTVMIGQGTLSDVTQKGPYDALDVITAGPVPPNASDLILSERMTESIAALKKNYDFVILDTPPISLISDALVLMQHVDTALLVTNVSKSSRRGVQHLEELLEQNNLSHASFVLNGVRSKRWARYYNRYATKYGYAAYGADYGYGYGYGGSERYKNPEAEA